MLPSWVFSRFFSFPLSKQRLPGLPEQDPYCPQTSLEPMECGSQLMGQFSEETFPGGLISTILLVLVLPLLMMMMM